MIEKIREVEEPFFVDGKIAIPYDYAAGRIASRFLIELRDNKKIFGLRCSDCEKVYVPPRSVCKYCFKQLDEWVEVSDKGTLITYTVIYRQNDAAQPEKIPFAYGIIQLDGANTGLVHMLGEVNFNDIKIGMRLQAAFKEERVASILDIKYFKPAA